MTGSRRKKGSRRVGAGGGKRRGTAGLKVVAFFEAAKGLAVVLAGLGVAALIHRHAQDVAEEIVRHLHFNPAKQMPHIFLDAAAAATNMHLWALALTALLYAMARFVEAYGLWHHQAWAEWFGILSGGIYLPIELTVSVSAVKVGVLLVNIIVVGWLTRVRWQTRVSR